MSAIEWSCGAIGPLLAPDDPDLSWQDAALCAQAHPDAWFPEKGGSVALPKAVCRRCPVRAACLEFALENDMKFGIWGGLSERQRRRIKRLSPRPVQVLCASGRHPRNGPGRCAECKRENNVKRGKARARDHARVYAMRVTRARERKGLAA